MKDIQQKIDDFLLKRLPETERQAFEAEIAADPELAQQLKVQKEIMGGIQVLGREKFKERLRRIQKEVQAEEPAPAAAAQKNPTWLWWLLGAIVIGLVLFFIWLLQAPAEPPAGIYADVFEPYSVSFTQRVPSEREFMKELETYYRNGEYQAFIERFEPVQLTYPHYPELQLALGISYLETGQLEKADEVLERLEKGDYSVYWNHAQWYRALAALKAENIIKTKKLLVPLAKDNTADHHKEARRLLRRLGE